MKLSIESQGVHKSLRTTLAAAANLKTIDAVYSHLSVICNPSFWIVYRGGHHVALIWKQNNVRVALISE